jgi:transglutaminase-like putative cysteine protease
MRMGIYLIAAVLFAMPLATWVGTLAAGLAVPLALLLGHRLARSQVRSPVVGAGVIGLLLLGLAANSWLGGNAWLARLLGTRNTLAVIELLTFGLLTVGAVMGLRTMALRRPTLALLEMAAVAAAMAAFFALHRDYPVSQPRFLSDWAFSHGHDPRLILLGLGFATLGVMVLLLLPRQRLFKTLATVVVLALLGSLGYLLLLGPGAWILGAAGGSSADDLDFGRSGPGPQFPIMLVTLHDDYVPAENNFYLRRGTWSQFNGTRLVEPTAPGVDEDILADFPRQKKDVPGRVAPQGLFRDLDTTVCLIRPLPRPAGLVRMTALEPIANPDPQKYQRAYRVSSQVLTTGTRAKPVYPYSGLRSLPAGGPAWAAQVRQHYLAMPADPRYRELAEKIVEPLSESAKSSPMARVDAVRRWIFKNTVYDYNPVHAGKADPVASFLFGDRRGYCVHVAHAVVYLLRAQGIPARVGVGSTVPMKDRGQGASFLVYSTHGHAWPEVFFEGVGWVIVDVSPGRRQAAPDPTPDPNEKMLYPTPQPQPPLPPADPDEEVDQSRSWFSWLLYLGLCLLAQLVLLLGCLYGVKAWRRLAPKWTDPAQLHRIGYRAVLDRLADVGLRRRFGETREEFARRLAGLLPLFRELTAAHQRRSLRECSPMALSSWQDLQACVEAGIAEKFSRLRRILGLVNPVSWMLVH